MPIGRVCIHEVVTTTRDTTITVTAKLMRQYHVGDVVIVDAPGSRKPVGIITDRDLVISVLAPQLDPNVFTVGDLLTRELVTARESQGVYETVQQMRTRGVRRMPIVDAHGDLTGIVSVDDLVQLLGDELNEIGHLIAREQAHEATTRQ
jgi:CBS domain-containing protein